MQEISLMLSVKLYFKFSVETGTYKHIHKYGIILNLLFEFVLSISQKFSVFPCLNPAIKNLILSKKGEKKLLSRCATYIATTNPLTFFSFS